MPKSVFTDAYAAFLSVLIAARKRNKVSQVELARRIGRDQPFISLIERGIRRVDVIEFCVIARGIGVDPVTLLQEVTDNLPDKIDI